MSDVRAFGATETAVLVAFRAAERSGLDAKECYQAGVEAWKRRHPDHTTSYAAHRAVRIILEARAPQLMETRLD